MKNQNIVAVEKSQTCFVGMDVHIKNWAVTIRTAGIEAEKFSMDPSPEKLSSHLKKHYPDCKYKACYEAGFCGFHIKRSLEENGVECIVVNPADVPTKDKERKYKRDSIDSSKLARELEKNFLTGIYVPSKEDERFRSLQRLTVSSIKNMTKTKNMIKSHMHFHGVKVPCKDECSHWSQNFIRRLEEMCIKGDPFGDYLLHCIEGLKIERARYLSLLKTIKAHLLVSAHKKRIVSLINSLPGIGFRTAVALVAEIFDMKRFKNIDHLCSFVGLVPSCKCSGDFNKDDHITNRSNKYLRYILIESAWIAIRKDRALLNAYRRYRRRMTGPEAIVRIAKKLLARVRYVWLNQKELEYERI